MKKVGGGQQACALCGWLGWIWNPRPLAPVSPHLSSGGGIDCTISIFPASRLCDSLTFLPLGACVGRVSLLWSVREGSESWEKSNKHSCILLHHHHHHHHYHHSNYHFLWAISPVFYLWNQADLNLKTCCVTDCMALGKLLTHPEPLFLPLKPVDNKNLMRWYKISGWPESSFPNGLQENPSELFGQPNIYRTELRTLEAPINVAF